MNEALRDWVTNVDDTYYMIGTAAGPHPYPEMVRDFQSVIGKEAASRCWPPKAACRTCWSQPSVAAQTPSAVPSVPRRCERPIVGVEAGGKGLDGRGALRLADRRFAGRPAWQPHLPASGPRRPDHGGPFDLGRPRLSRHRPGALLAAGHRSRRIRADHGHEALAAFQMLTRLEGIIPALEPAMPWPRSSSALRKWTRTRSS